MTPADFRAARKALGLTQTGMALALRLSPTNGARSIRIWEKDGNTVPGPVQVAVELMLANRGELPARYLGEPIPARCKEDWTRNFTRGDSDGDDGA